MQAIYLDNNSTTPIRPCVLEAMIPLLRESFGNPSGIHIHSRSARRLLEDARDRIAALLHCRADEVIFTSGATEANNLALFGLVREAGHLLLSPLEHPCVLEPAKKLAEVGYRLELLPTDTLGRVDPAVLRERLQADTRLVSIMLVNHETGVIEPIRALREAAPAVVFHCDAAQAVGRIPVDFSALGVDALTLSGHKFGAPKGIGALILRRNRPLTPMLYGGFQQQGRRPGTEPTPLAVALAVALEEACREMVENLRRLRDLREQLRRGLAEHAEPIVVHSPLDETGSPWTLNVSFPGCRGDLLVAALDLAGVACGTGSACASGSTLPSPVLRALRLPDEWLRSAVRFGLAPTLSAAAIHDAVQRIAAIVQRFRSPDDSPEFP